MICNKDDPWAILVKDYPREIKLLNKANMYRETDHWKLLFKCTVVYTAGYKSYSHKLTLLLYKDKSKFNNWTVYKPHKILLKISQLYYPQRAYSDMVPCANESKKQSQLFKDTFCVHNP